MTGFLVLMGIADAQKEEEKIQKKAIKQLPASYVRLVPWLSN